MEQITAEGLRVANDLSQRYGFSQEAVVHMMAAILRGRGGMAQFNHPEFAGSGQWMQGGMLMIGDMFNNGLKARVDGLCQAISAVLGSQSDLFPVGSFQSQSQSGPGQQQQVGGSLGQQMQVGGGTQQQSRSTTPTPTAERSPLFVPDPRDSWWPKQLGTPNATGEQNNVRYAYFGDSGRLAVEANGQLNVYDTGEHRISGFSQQQTPAGAVVFSTPAGTVSLSSLSTASAMASGGSQQAQNTTAAGQQQQVSSGAGQQQANRGGGFQQQASGGMASGAFGGGMPAMTPMGFTPMAPFPSMDQPSWWPVALGSPSATGSQNNLRYAVFSSEGRLAVELDGNLTIYDTRPHAVSGVSQQGQGEGQEVVVTTAAGPLRLSEFPVVSPVATETAEATATPTPASATSGSATSTSATPTTSPSIENDVISSLERLGALKDKGILTEEEFTAKKAELLSRL
jgi:hypothetical protein